MAIIPASIYGNAREQASRELPHGLTPSTIEKLAERFESFVPGISETHGTASHSFFDDVLPKGATLDPRTRKSANFPGGGLTFPGLGMTYGGGIGGSGGTLVSPQRPYMPEFECQRGASKIMLADGTFKQLKDVVVGDRILDKTGSVQIVEKAWCSGTPDEIVEIKLWGNKSFYTTKNHCFPVWAWLRKCLCGCGKDVTIGRCYVLDHGPGNNQYSESNLKIIDGKGTYYHNRRCIPKDYTPLQRLRADEIRVGDCLLVPRKFDAIAPSIVLDQARLLGYYISEGSLRDQTRWSLGKHEAKTLAIDIQNICAKLDVQTHFHTSSHRNTCDVTTNGNNGKSITEWLYIHGRKNAADKCLSEEVMRWPIKYKIELIRGMYKGDGSQYSTKTIKDGYDSWKFCVAYGTSSKLLSLQTQLILAQLGIFASVITIRAKKRSSKGNIINQHEHYRLVTYGLHAKRLSKMVWEDDDKSIEHQSNDTRERYRVDDNYIYIPVKSVKIIQNNEPVHNLTVSGDHSYLVDNIGTYNSPDRCCVEGTLINMFDGTLKPIEQIKTSDLVVDRLGYPQKVVRQWCSGAPDELVEIKLYGGNSIYVTKPHQVPVWAWARKCLCGCGRDIEKIGKCYLPHHANRFNLASNGTLLKYIDGNKTKSARYIPDKYEPHQKLRADQLKSGDFLMIPRGFSEIKTNITKDQARLLGYYVAEGCKNTAGASNRLVGSIWYFSINEMKTWVADVVRILQKLKVDTKVKIDQRYGTGCAVITTGKNAKVLARWLIEHAGEYAITKKFSQEVMRWPLKLKEELVRGAFRGDGSQFINNVAKHQTHRVTYKTISSLLARQLQLILAQIGIYGSLYTYQSKNPKHNLSYILNTSNSHSRKLAKLVWNNVKDPGRSNRPREIYKVDDRFVYVPIRSVKIIKNKESVYNMTVAGDHSYLIENIGSFNSSYPVHRILANRYWRLFYKLDPVIGTCLDLFSTLPWSDFQLSGEGVTGEIKEAFEAMCQECELLKILEYMVREFLCIGEVAAHSFLDESKGLWSYIALHNPDQLEIIDAPFIRMDPVIEFIPDDRLRAVLTSNNHLLRKIREQMPPELISRLVARQNIPLSPINCTFLPRKLHPYDTRGTSIISRMWRVLLYEDSLFNASIQTARRQSSPLKIAKLGNPQTGWIPSPEHEQRLLRLLAQAEYDPCCFTEDTPVMLGDGTMKVIKDIVPGDMVLDRNGSPSEVVSTHTEETNKLIRFRTIGDEYIECTPNHNWPIWGFPRYCSCGCGQKVQFGNFISRHGSDPKGYRYSDKKYGVHKIHERKVRFLEGFDPHQKVRADEIRKFDYLKIPRKFKEVIPSDVTSDKAWLLGLYLAESHTSDVRIRNDGSKCLGFELSLSKHEKHLAQKAGEIVGYQPECFFGQYNNLQARFRRNDSNNISEWLFKHAGKYAKDKKLSLDVMRWPLNLKYMMLAGYVAGDGSFISRKDGGYVEISTASYSLAHQIKLICAQLGYLASYSVRFQRPGSWVEGNIIYRLHIFGKLAADLAKDAKGIDIKIDNRTVFSWCDDDYLYVQVRKIEEINLNKPKKVINLSVAGDHSYLVYGGIGTYNSWITYHYGIQFELVGVQERAMNIGPHSEFIDKMKLVALGISKGLLHGEISYASSYTGLSVFLQRLKSLRNFFVNSWIIPKFFKPIAKINGWIRRDPGEIAHRYRVKRSQRELELENRYIIPKMEWEKQLDNTINSELVNAMQALEGLGIKFSKTTKYAAVNRSFEEEVRKIKEEQKFEMEMSQYVAPAQVAGGPGMPAGGMPGLPPPPPGPETPPEVPGMPGGPETPPVAASSDKEGAGGGVGPSGKKDPAVRDMESSVWDHKGHAGNWSASEIHELDRLIQEGHTDSPIWGDLDAPKFRSALATQDPWEVLEVIEEHLGDLGYPESDVKQLRKILDREGILKRIAEGDIEGLKKVEGKVGDLGELNDQEALNKLSAKLGEGEDSVTKLRDPDLLFTGAGNQDIPRWSGDIGDLISNK